ncbi:MAG TPA: HAMP domain-containing sensor histidine kinase [Myxococcota bacterium]|nr:HAMP domain-containing sensor histidine kinase [Myxococcota bacterium]
MAPNLEPDDVELVTLVAGMAHEINNPITYVLGNLSELAQTCAAMAETLSGYRREVGALAGGAAPARIHDIEAKLRELGGVALAEELVVDASEGARRIRDLVRDLLSLARSPHSQYTPLRIDDVLEQTLRLVARPSAARAELVRDLGATHTVLGDAQRLGQVFLNLLTNALDACAAVAGRAHTICVRSRDLGRAVRIEIDDTGSGIDAAERGRVFAPFVTTKPPGAGTGLGLYVSKRIVAAHRGDIGFEDLPGGGTRFWVELPASPAAK